MNKKDKQNLIILLILGVVIFFIIKKKKSQPTTRIGKSQPTTRIGKSQPTTRIGKSYGSQSSSSSVKAGQDKGGEDIPIEETPQFKKWGRGKQGETRFDKDGYIYVWYDGWGWVRTDKVPVTSPLTEEAANSPQFAKWGYGEVGHTRTDDNGDIYMWQDYNGWQYIGNVEEQTGNDGGKKDGGKDFIDAYTDYLAAAGEVIVKILPFIA